MLMFPLFTERHLICPQDSSTLSQLPFPNHDFVCAPSGTFPFTPPPPASAGRPRLRFPLSIYYGSTPNVLPQWAAESILSRRRWTTASPGCPRTVFWSSRPPPFRKSGPLDFFPRRVSNRALLFSLTRIFRSPRPVDILSDIQKLQLSACPPVGSGKAFRSPVRRSFRVWTAGLLYSFLYPSVLLCRTLSSFACAPILGFSPRMDSGRIALRYLQLKPTGRR